MKAWKKASDELFQGLLNDIQFSLCIQMLGVSTPQQQYTVLLQEEPTTGLVGSKINSEKLMSFLMREPVVHVICIYGMGGVGKIALLKRTYNVFKVNRGDFDFLIWVKIGQFPNLADLQSCIIHKIKLKAALIVTLPQFLLIIISV